MQPNNALFDQFVIPAPERVKANNRSIATIALAVALAGVAAASLQFDVTAKSESGRYRPIGETRHLTQADGGKITLKAKINDHVSAGQVLAEISPIRAEGDAKSIAGTIESLRAKQVLLDAEADNSEPAWGDLAETLIGRQMIATYQADQATRLALEHQITGQKQSIQALESKLARQHAVSQGGASPVEIDNLNQEHGKLLSDLAGLESRLADLRSHAAAERNDVAQKLAELQAKQASITATLADTSITAPVAGWIKSVTPASTLRPGEEVLELVPEDQAIIEAKLASKDLPGVHVGSTASVEVEGYSYQDFGHVDAVVEAISADSDVDQRDGKISRKVTLKPLTGLVDKGGTAVAIPMGAEVHASIVTGKRSFWGWLTAQHGVSLKDSFSGR